MFLQGQKGVPAPDADVVKGGFDDRTIVEDRADLPRDRLALFQRRPRRQLIFDLAVITVGRRLELLREDEQQADAGGEGDRKSVGPGKGVSVRVDLGGSRIIKKKNKKKT